MNSVTQSIVTCRGIRVNMIGFINSLVTHTLLITLKFTGNTVLSLIYTHSSSLLHMH
jgi:hypothetical protein